MGKKKKNLCLYFTINYVQYLNIKIKSKVKQPQTHVSLCCETGIILVSLGPHLEMLLTLKVVLVVFHAKLVNYKKKLDGKMCAPVRKLGSLLKNIWETWDTVVADFDVMNRSHVHLIHFI